MSTLQITLSEPLHQFVTRQVAELGLDHPDQYLEQLLEEEQRKSLEEYYWQKCQESIAKGGGTVITEENREAYWEEIADRIERRVAERKRKVAQ